MSTNANDYASTAPDADLPPQPAGEAAEVKGGAADIFTPAPTQGVLIGLLLPAVQAPISTVSSYQIKQ